MIENQNIQIKKVEKIKMFHFEVITPQIFRLNVQEGPDEPVESESSR